MAKTLIHLGTVIHSVFGLTDENNNVVEQYRIAPNSDKPLTTFDLYTLSHAFNEMAELKAKLEAEKCHPSTES